MEHAPGPEATIDTLASSREPASPDPASGDPTEGDGSAHPDRAVMIRTLGGFQVFVEGRPASVTPGLPCQALKFVIARGGSVHHEVLIDRLWPDASLDEGRKGVRNMLTRLGRGLPDLLVRDGDSIRIAPHIVVDGPAFRAAADRVLLNAGAEGAAAGARAALARYGGPFLPDDHGDDIDVVREQLRRRHIALLDLLSADARRRGSMMEALHLLESAIEADPLDEIRYLEAAEILLRAGRRGRAARLVQRSHEVLAEHGLPPGPAWERIERALVEGQLPPRPALRPPAAGPPPRPRP